MKDLMDDLNTPVQTPDTVFKNESEPQRAYTQNYGGYADPGNYRGTAGEYSSQSDNASSYGGYSDYSYSESYGGGSVLTEYLKAALGAVVGAIPGMILWILLGKAGFVAAICGLVLAGGVVTGYTFMTKDNSAVEMKWGVAMCIAILLIAIYLAEKIVWTWEMVDQFQKLIPSIRAELTKFGDAFGLTDEELAEYVSDEAINAELQEAIGFSSGTFGECFTHFGKLLDYFGAKASFCFSLLQGYAFAALGGGSLLWRFSKNR